MFQTGKEKTSASAAEQPVDIGRDAAPVDRDVVVFDPVLAAHDRIEPLRVEVAVVDVVAARAKRLDKLARAAAAAKLVSTGWAKRTRMRNGAAQICAARARASRPGKRKFLPAEKSKFGSSHAIILPGLSRPSGSVSRLKASWVASVCFMPPSSSV